MAKQPETGKGGRFESKANPFSKKASSTAISLTGVTNIASVLDCIARAGCAILIGATRDGGAIVLTVLDGDTRHRTYCSTEAELEEAFTALWDMYHAD